MREACVAACIFVGARDARDGDIHSGTVAGMARHYRSIQRISDIETVQVHDRLLIRRFQQCNNLLARGDWSRIGRDHQIFQRIFRNRGKICPRDANLAQAMW